MFKLVAFLCLLALCAGKSVDGGESIYGTYKVVYTWPKWTRAVTCSEVVFTKAPAEANLSCQCEKQIEKQALIHEKIISSQNMEFNLLADIVENTQELEKSLANKCTCTPSNRSRTIIYKSGSGHLFQKVQGSDRVYLLSKVVPTAEELANLISGIPEFKDEEGTLFCP